MNFFRWRKTIYLITNGMLLSPEELAHLKQLGVKVMISIDGATPATYEAINFTILKANYTEIPGILELAHSIGVQRVPFIGLKPCEDYAEQLISPQEYGEAIKLACQGLLGGKYKSIVDSLELRGAKGTMFDHILLKGVELGRP